MRIEVCQPVEDHQVGVVTKCRVRPHSLTHATKPIAVPTPAPATLLQAPYDPHQHKHRQESDLGAVISGSGVIPTIGHYRRPKSACQRADAGQV